MQSKTSATPSSSKPLASPVKTSTNQKSDSGATTTNRSVGASSTTPSGQSQGSGGSKTGGGTAPSPSTSKSVSCGGGVNVRGGLKGTTSDAVPTPWCVSLNEVVIAAPISCASPCPNSANNAQTNYLARSLHDPTKLLSLHQPLTRDASQARG